MPVDAIVAGAGLWGGGTIARRLSEVASSGGKLVVGGRLGECRYYDMDKSIAAALEVADSR